MTRTELRQKANNLRKQVWEMSQKYPENLKEIDRLQNEWFWTNKKAENDNLWIGGREVGEKPTKTEKLAKALEAIRSAHVQSVMVGFEYEADGVRYYSAVTRKAQVLHSYKVRVWNEVGDSGETERWAKCNCGAAAKEMMCRHIVKVAEYDSAITGAKIHPENISEYKAYQHYQKAA